MLPKKRRKNLVFVPGSYFLDGPPVFTHRCAYAVGVLYDYSKRSCSVERFCSHKFGNVYLSLGMCRSMGRRMGKGAGKFYYIIYGSQIKLFSPPRGSPPYGKCDQAVSDKSDTYKDETKHTKKPEMSLRSKGRSFMCVPFKQ